MKRIIMFCLLIMLLPSVMFADNSSATVATSNTTSMVIQTSTTNDPSKTCSLQLSYPQFVGNNLSAAQQSINQTLQNFTKQQWQSFLANNAKYSQSATGKNNTKNVNLLKIDGIVTQATGKIISIRFTVMIDYWYAAHPSMRYFSFNFDSATGKPIALSSLFKSDPNYLQTIAALVQPKLIKQLYPNVKSLDPKNFESSLLNQGSAPTAANYSIWNIKNNQLMITFQPEQVAPDYYGASTVLIPLPH